VLVRQSPGTAGGVCYITIEGESGYYNLVVFEKLFNTYRKEILHSKLLRVEGHLQREGKAVHLIVSRYFDFTKMLGNLMQREIDDLPALTLARGDEKSAPYPAQYKRTQVREDVLKEAFHGGRNFKSRQPSSTLDWYKSWLLDEEMFCTRVSAVKNLL